MRSVRDTYGASTTNTPAQNTDAFQSAFAAGHPFSVPDETYICNALTFTASSSVPRIDMIGEGFASCILTPSFTYNCPVASYGTRIRSLTIAPTGSASDGLKIVQTTDPGAFYDFIISDVSIATFPGRALIFDNTIASSDGFFDGAIRDCLLAKGFLGNYLGDRLTFENIKVYGGSLIGFQSSHLAGARECVIRESTFVTTGGGILTSSAEQMQVYHNVIEQPSTSNYAGWNGSSVISGYMDAMVCMLGGIGSNLRDNRITASNGVGGCVGAGYDVIMQDGNTATGNYLGASRYANRAVNQVGLPISGNVNN